MNRKMGIALTRMGLLMQVWHMMNHLIDFRRRKLEQKKGI